ncbi:MAG: tetratricopeptide repeat protein [Thermodesulfobacteriota bacterium]
MTPRFASREFHFLKPDSKTSSPIQAPDFYFSDLVHRKTAAFTAFEQRLLSADIPRKKFVCAVIQLAETASEDTREKARGVFESWFSSMSDNQRGIWETLDNRAFVLVFWDYDTRKKAMSLLESLKTKITRALETDLLAGVAWFPFQNRTRSEVFANALKAIDHAAFFGFGHTQHFDGISLNISGDRLYQLKQYDIAIQEYEKGLVLAPRDINLMNSLGVCYGVTGDLEKARASFETALEINPKEIMVLYNLGLTCQVLEDTDKAIFFLRKAHGIDGRIFEVELLLGHLLFQTQKFDAALPHLETASQVNPRSSMALRIMGEIYLKQQAPDQAKTAFNTAVKLNPLDPAALSGYALAMTMKKKKRNLKIALTFAEKSVALAPENKVFQDRLVRVQQTLDENDDDHSQKLA